jgi:uncharacterized surface protein with fasciclin (FAS1) repeats
MTISFRKLAATLLVSGMTMCAGTAMADQPWEFGGEQRLGIEPVRVHGTIVDVAVKTPALSTLVTALTAANLVTTLQGPGPFTVFAPTNEAFSKVPAPVLSFLLSDVAALKSVLLYHVAAGKVTDFDREPTAVTTVQGEKVFIRAGYHSGEIVLTVNNSNVVLQPIEVDNGVVYVIDSVLLPQF